MVNAISFRPSGEAAREDTDYRDHGKIEEEFAIFRHQVTARRIDAAEDETGK
jgi:hypothetical protein